MSWVRLDDAMPDSLKIAPLSDAAFRAYVTSICYCARILSDGFVPAKKAKDVAGRPRVVQELTDAGLWAATDTGFLVHDYLVYNPSREQVEAERAIAKRRHAMNADPEFAKRVKDRDGNRCRYCGVLVNWRDRKGAMGGTYDHVLPIFQGGQETFDNLVVACRSCNVKKGARRPEEAGMALLALPESSLNLDGITPELRQPVPRSPSRSRPIHPSDEGERERRAGAATRPELEPEPDDRPFALEYIRRVEQRDARPPSPIEKAAARQLERDFGTEKCREIAADFDWKKNPQYLRKVLEDRADGTNPNGANSGVAGLRGGSPGVEAGLSDLERLRAAVAARGQQG